MPQHVILRTTDPSLVGISRRGSMTGTTSRDSWLLGYRAGHPHDDVSAAVLLNLPTRRIEPVLPHGMTRAGLRKAQRGDAGVATQVRVPMTALGSVNGPAQGYRAEPVELALPDTVSRMAFRNAVAVLDALLGRRASGHLPSSSEPLTWGEDFLSQRLTARWRAALVFADGAAESPGESVSRALIHEQGFVPPALQVRVATDLGEERVDFEWTLPGRSGHAPRRIVGEFDGRGKYFDETMLEGRTAKEVHYAEKLREDALRRTGRKVVRWGWADLSTPDILTKRLLRAGVPRSSSRADGQPRRSPWADE
ncbi:hypothetical protein [Nesterenkonia sp. Act20]|uniref:hypothetical protein n=1 Tax=Nesterenkonia sp. Act20 TaxID=1483432 RepID=UPI001C4410AB|nr:hypothetical protein [Nesterenkonia sp. Act20]